MSTLCSIKNNMICLSLVLAFTFLLSIEAQADIYDSWAIVENNSGIASIVASQLSVEVTDPGVSGQVLFTFSNTGSYSFYISDIYFDDGTLLGIASIDNSDPGVSFGFPASSGNLPGGNTVDPDFVTSTDTGHFSTDNDSGAINGVHPGESVGIQFDLIGGNTFADTIDALNVGFNPSTYYTGSGLFDGWTSANLRIGVHVQGIGDNGEFSDTLILTPIPPSMIIGMLGICVAGLKLRKYA
jgi:hypothetical protein